MHKPTQIKSFLKEYVNAILVGEISIEFLSDLNFYFLIYDEGFLIDYVTDEDFANNFDDVNEIVILRGCVFYV